MARGFESKSVQSQWQDAEVERAARKRKKPEDRETMERRKHRESIELSRRRVERELAETKSDRRREQLRAALAHLDAELKRIGDSG
ncbi:MAG TPA: hypothetical protein VEO74_09625 [Thermoanaerobaculia bacterium]|nr:hypothetical protein [Thermoanaerobaculia bacterium]